MSGKNAISPTSFSLNNDNGMDVTILSAGAAISRIVVPNLCGKKENVVLSFENDKMYWENSLYAGAVLGPVAGRIS